MKEAYLKTDDAIDAVLTTKKLAEWRLISRIQDWRSEHVEHVHFLTEETGFYLSFLVDLRSLVLTDVASLSDVIKWKSFYEYRRISNQLLRFALLLRLFSNTGTNKKDVCLKSTSFFAADEQLFIRLLEPLHFSANPFYDSWKPKVRNSSLSIAFDMLAEFHQIIYGCANRTDAGWKTEVANVVRILSDQQKELFGALTIRNTNLMNECLIVFCVCFLEMFLVGLFSYFFVMLFKIETKILALVTDWCSDLQIKVDDQSLSTQSILCKVSAADDSYYVYKS
ncbi:hypothetical protein DPMN_157898 [Dreissena polymorpha]|uniref:Uncharacterized protein n=1 Tax=Dreissena polymorpha TaxID=45954 RepID=A0A9D4EIT6_DREPO|nr:hypothetical protein DPMN_157898 [Dreissena polymorpha]